MIIDYFTRHIKYKKRSKIRSYMRGYNFLNKSQKLSYLTQLKDLLVLTSSSGIQLQNLFKSPEKICLHQLLVSNLFNIEFNKSILRALVHPKKKLHHALPKQWRDVLEKEGFIVNTFENRFFWYFFQMRMYLTGLATGIIEFKRLINKHKIPKTLFIYLDNLTKNNLPNDDFQDNNILDWVINRNNKTQFNSIYHSVKNTKQFRFKNKSIRFIDSVIPLMNSTKNILQYTLWLTTNSFLYLFKSEDRLLFREKVFNKLVKLSNANQLPKECYFHNSNHVFRPLWTYAAAKKGVEILFYFYSTNIASVKLKGEKYIQMNNWNIVTWPNYLVWNQTQFDFIRKHTLFKSKIEIVGPIPFRKTNDFKIKKSNKKRLLVFDIQPLRASFYQSVALNNEYFTPNNSITFLDDINNLASLFDLEIILKRKRTTPLVDKKYLRKINQLSLTGRWLFIDPDLDAYQVSKKIKPIASISTPYSSTGIITSRFKIPTIYYDSTSKIDESLKANNEICVLNNFESLTEWFTLIDQKNNA